MEPTKESSPTWNAIIAAFLLFCVFVIVGSAVRSCGASQPDPWFRMNSPSGCSGTWIFANRQRGILGATCKHCVARRGGRVRVTLFKDGERSPRHVDAVCLASHPRWDCSIIWISPREYRYPELPRVIPVSPHGPQVGSAVYTVGSFASGTVTPAIRKLRVTGFRSDGFEFRSDSDFTWSGHSGGGVVDVATGQLVGVVWGTTSTATICTSSRAIWETLYGRERRRSTSSAVAAFSVTDDVGDDVGKERTADITPPVVDVYADQSDLDKCGFNRERREDANMRSVQWRFHQGRWTRPDGVRLEWTTQTLRGQQRWYIDGWPGIRNFIARFNRTVSAEKRMQYCPDCQPRGPRGRDESGLLPNPWDILPPRQPQQPVYPPPPQQPLPPLQPAPDVLPDQPPPPGTSPLAESIRRGVQEIQELKRRQEAKDRDLADAQQQIAAARKQPVWRDYALPGAVVIGLLLLAGVVWRRQQ
jgi:hypothetical protein